MPQILLCGNEGEQFLFENALVTSAADSKRRGAVRMVAGDQMFRQFPTGYADMWLHIRMNPEIAFGLSGGEEFISIRAGTRSLARVFGEVVSGTTQFFRIDTPPTMAGTAFTNGPSFPHQVATWVTYDIRVRVSTTTNSNDTLRVDFYRNEVLRHSVTTIDPAGWALPNAVLIQSRTLNTQGDDTLISDVIVTDAVPTVGMELATLVPSAVGFYDDFTNDYTAIDDLGYNQSTVISTATPNDRESWFFSEPLFDLGDKVIYAVAMTTVAQTDLAGVIDDFEPFLRINATNYPNTPLGANNISPNAYMAVWTVNPATLAPWSLSELNGLEAGLRAL